MTPEQRQQRLEAALGRWRRRGHGGDRARGAGKGAEEGSFREIVEILYPPMHAFFVRQGIGKEEAHDLTQESFVGIHRGLGAFRADSQFTTWAFTIAKNTLRKHHRDRQAQKRGAGERPLSLEEELREPASPHPDPLGQVIDSERRNRLRRAVEALPPRMRTVLKMHLYQERTRLDIADALAISPETVKAQLGQARRRLALELQDGGSAQTSESEKRRSLDV